MQFLLLIDLIYEVFYKTFSHALLAIVPRFSWKSVCAEFRIYSRVFVLLFQRTMRVAFDINYLFIMFLNCCGSSWMINCDVGDFGMFLFDVQGF